MSLKDASSFVAAVIEAVKIKRQHIFLFGSIYPPSNDWRNDGCLCEVLRTVLVDDERDVGGAAVWRSLSISNICWRDM